MEYGDNAFLPITNAEYARLQDLIRIALQEEDPGLEHEALIEVADFFNVDYLIPGDDDIDEPGYLQGD